MWLLEIFMKQSPPEAPLELSRGPSYLIESKREHLLGRLNCDLLIEETSVSRKHTKFEIGEKGDLYVTDLASKYGTHLENDGSNIGGRAGFTTFPANVKVAVGHASAIRIGVNTYVKVFKTSLLTVACTRLDKPEKDLLKLRLKKLGARLVDQVTSDTNYVVSNRYFATVKVLMALVFAKPIVVPHFFEFCDRLKESSSASSGGSAAAVDDSSSSSNRLSTPVLSIPSIFNYAPQADDHEIVEINKARSILLSDYTVFVQDSEEDYMNLLRGCDAKVVSLSAPKYTFEILCRLCNTDYKSENTCIFYNESLPIDFQNSAQNFVNENEPLNWLTSGNLAMAIIKSSKVTLSSVIPSFSSSSNAASQQQQQQQSQRPRNSTTRQSSILVLDSNPKSIGNKRPAGESDAAEDISPDILKDSIAVQMYSKPSSANDIAFSKKQKVDGPAHVETSGDLFEEDSNLQQMNRKNDSSSGRKSASSESATKPEATVSSIKSLKAVKTESTKNNNNKKAKVDDENVDESEENSAATFDISNIAVPRELQLNLDTHIVRSPELPPATKPSSSSSSSSSNNRVAANVDGKTARSTAATAATSATTARGTKSSHSSSSNSNSNSTASVYHDADYSHFNFSNSSRVLLPGWLEMPRGEERSKIVSEKTHKLLSSRIDELGNEVEVDEMTSSAFVKAEPAGSIEVNLISRSSQENSAVKRSNDGAAVGVTSLRDKRPFVKNFVKNVSNGCSGTSTSLVRADISVVYEPMFSMENMEKLLPKETEREIQLRKDYEHYQNRTIEKEKLFSDRLLATQKKNR